MPEYAVGVVSCSVICNLRWQREREIFKVVVQWSYYFVNKICTQVIFAVLFIVIFYSVSTTSSFWCCKINFKS